MCYYDARIGSSIYGGMFNPITYEPFCTYYSFYAFGQLYRLGGHVKCETGIDGVYALAATDGTDRAMVIANISDEDQTFTTDLPDGMKVYVIDEAHHCTLSEISPNEFTIGKHQVYLIREDR